MGSTAQHSINLQAGPNFSNLYSPNGFFFEMGTGYQLGLNYQYFSNGFGIESGINLTKKTYKSSVFFSDQFGFVWSQGQIDHTYFYTSIPVLFSYSFGTTFKSTPFLGANFELLNSALIEFPDVWSDLPMNFKESCRPLLLSPIVGIEFAYSFKRIDVFSRLNGQFSLNPVFRNDASEFDNERFYSIGNQFGCRFKFNK